MSYSIANESVIQESLAQVRSKLFIFGQECPINNILQECFQGCPARMSCSLHECLDVSRKSVSYPTIRFHMTSSKKCLERVSSRRSPGAFLRMPHRSVFEGTECPMKVCQCSHNFPLGSVRIYSQLLMCMRVLSLDFTFSCWLWVRFLSSYYIITRAKEMSIQHNPSHSDTLFLDVHET